MQVPPSVCQCSILIAVWRRCRCRCTLLAQHRLKVSLAATRCCSPRCAHVASARRAQQRSAKTLKKENGGSAVSQGIGDTSLLLASGSAMRTLADTDRRRASIIHSNIKGLDGQGRALRAAAAALRTPQAPPRPLRVIVTKCSGGAGRGRPPRCMGVTAVLAAVLFLLFFIRPAAALGSPCCSSGKSFCL